ncbi:GM14988 [Drosophila sechellia]|uniref:GM14988 n=2 Tax=melanogaster subgroup TaxID=32351 RepID=B4IFU9_DROSE|nr:GM14988 [Drosophila sechellia]
MLLTNSSRIRPRWWSGGVAGAIAQCFTAPFDLIEARMVVIKKDRGMASNLQQAIRTHGFISLYDGLSAQLVRQLTYTSLRFHLYEMGKEHLDDPAGLWHKVLVAALAGCVAGVVGTPMELINTRMQVNRALPKETRWNYRNVFDGLYRVTREEGFTKLYSGCFLSFMRSSLITISQNAAYDQAKQIYAEVFHMKHDNTLLHLISSVTAAFICGPIIKPIENLRYLRMVDSRRLLNSISYMMRFGSRGPFRGLQTSEAQLIVDAIASQP